MIVNGDREDLFGLRLADDVLIELGDEFAGRGNAVEQRLGRSAAALLLVQNALAQLNAFATDVDVPGPFNERADIAIALATERAEGVFLRGAGPTTPSPSP